MAMVENQMARFDDPMAMVENQM
ncbi:hypothetical protein MNBD_PLANCTO03-1200, partial [hydrothermal vent metagenome]